MKTKTIHQCQCEKCRETADSLEKQFHHQINVVMSRLDEQQKRWYAAVEANRYREKGVPLVSQITGLDEKQSAVVNLNWLKTLLPVQEIVYVWQAAVVRRSKKRCSHRKRTQRSCRG